MRPLLLRRAGAAILFAALCLSSVRAQSWTERPYAPPVGSKWSIVSETDTVEQRAAGNRRNQHVKVRYELTIEEKLAGGYRISYVNRDMQITGNTAEAAILNDAFSAMKGIVVRARTDAAGKPVEVENLDEVKAALRIAVDRMVARFQDKPQIASFLRQLMSGFVDVDAQRAASTYLDELPSLAAAQNSGLKPGDVRRTDDEVPSPFGGVALKSALVTRLESWDDKTGKARILRKRETDPEALKALVVGIARQLLKATDQDAMTPQMVEVMKQVDFSIAAETRYDVEGGMTRAVDERTITTASAMGHSFRKDEHKSVMVTPVR